MIFPIASHQPDISFKTIDMKLAHCVVRRWFRWYSFAYPRRMARL